MKRRGCDWQRYVLKNYDFLAFRPGARVLDLGCGAGEQLGNLRSQGVVAVGLDPDGPSLQECRKRQLKVVQARAEAIPMKGAGVDGILCKVVIPYTDESRAFTEISRVLIAGGRAHCVYHGAGYYLRSFLYENHWKHRVYALRALLNTWLYALSGLRFPGFLGDTLYQSRGRLAECYRKNNLLLVHDAPAQGFLGLPVFIYQTIRKVGP